VTPAYRDVLAVRDARALIGASAASQIGNWLYNAALLTYVYSVTHSAGWVAAATIFRLMPYVLLGPWGGAIADRYPRRTVLVVGDLLRVGLMGALAAVVAASGPVAVVLVLTALATAGGCAERPAAMALLPRLVGETRLGAANALLHTVQDLGVVIGPALGAVLLVVGPPWIAFLANAATFLISGLLISTMRAEQTQPGLGERAAGQLGAGLQAVRRTPFAVWLIAVVSMVEFTYGAQTVQLVVYAKHSLGLGRGGYGVLLAAAGLGGVLSAIVNGRLAASRRVSLILCLSAAMACVTQLVYASSDVVAIALVITVAGCMGLVSCEVVGETALARITPRPALGRVVGIYDAAAVAATVAGAVLASVLVAVTSLRISLLVLGAGALAVTGIGWLSLRGLDALSAGKFDALASRIKVLERLPVTVGVPQIVLEQLAFAAEFTQVPAGVDVVVQGQPADSFYAVVHGRVVVHRDGRVRVHLGPGDSFGERGLLDSAPRNATVTTELDSELLRIDGHALIDALQSAPSLQPALDLSSTSQGIPVPPEDRVPDPRWAET
jgi:MFS family permease